MSVPNASPRRWADLLPRIASALVMTVLALTTAVAGGHVFVLFWLVAAAAVLWEWERLIGRERASQRFLAGSVSLAIAVGLGVAGLWGWAVLVTAAGALIVGLIAGAQQAPMAAAGVVYAGALTLSLTLLRLSFPGGLEAVLWLFAVVWGTDVMAYFGGRLVGGPKLWPRLSPAKTWSGFLIGVASGSLAGLAVSPAVSAHAAVLVIGAVAGVVSQGGDLLESLIKRRYGVKDASHLIPGHGGVMDRLDGFVVAAVFAAILGSLHNGLDGAGEGLFIWH